MEHSCIIMECVVFSVDGALRLQEYTLRDTNVLDIRVSTWHPLTSQEVPTQVVNYVCDMEMGLTLSSPIKSRSGTRSLDRMQQACG